MSGYPLLIQWCPSMVKHLKYYERLPSSNSMVHRWLNTLNIMSPLLIQCVHRWLNTLNIMSGCPLLIQWCPSMVKHLKYYERLPSFNSMVSIDG